MEYPSRFLDESLFFHGAVTVTCACIVGVLGYRCTERQLISSVFKLLPGRLPAGTGKFEFQRTVPTIARVNRGRNAHGACHLHLSLRLWMEYSFADLDNDYGSDPGAKIGIQPLKPHLRKDRGSGCEFGRQESPENPV